MLSNRDIVALQKIYDHSYLSCSKAVYYEDQGDENEATRHWRAALRRINEYYASSNAPRLSVSYTDTDAALIDALKELELQCKERLDLLEALRLSREDSLAASASRDYTTPTTQASGSTNQTPGTIGQGTIPAVTYSELSRPVFSPRTSLDAMTSSEDTIRRVRSTPADSAQRSYSRPNSRTPDLLGSQSDNPARPSSPERHTMRTTLRSKKTSDRPSVTRRLSRPAADGPSKAATLAWSSSAAQTNYLRPLPGERPSPKSSPAPRQSLERGSPSSQRPTQLYEPRSSRTSPQKWMSDESRLPQPSVLSISAASSALTSSTSPEPSMPYQTPSKSEQYLTPRRPFVYEESPSQSRRGSTKAGAGSNIGTPLLYKYDTERGDRLRDDTRQSYFYTSSYAVDTPQRKAELANPRLSRRRSSEDAVGGTTREDQHDKTQKKKSTAAILKNLPPGIDEGAAKQILNDIVVQGDEVHWSDIAGLEVAKNSLRETVVYPFLRPDLFMGLREPARGMLLFGPPGTGKTMLARAVATESKSTFFSISASSLTSKYLGESEKLVRALFGLAKALAPSIIFVDEIDSLLSHRSDAGEHEATRRIKTEFLIQWSELQRAAAGRETSSSANPRNEAQRVLVLAATNLPWAIDEAARRRFVRRQYIPLPEPQTRETHLRTLLRQQNHSLTDEDIAKLVQLTDGFSGSDITALAKDAAMGPLRSLGEALLYMTKDEIRPMDLSDFEQSLKSIRPSVDKEGLREYEEWAEKFGERGG
ncbi:AAA-domain-containing protein [Trichoderma citrinoviride]|uniref:AAA-domain-containing protein n=1 Tax=Trichoderma citrinoviride TaxID=58853 RepID=A0A2T4AZJ9_9HYPO|nr:AAA-domain-containing protein [Trichoderma citrinoviride]PTB62499.1 AAA-domain-containing protein [Trichoderma citrinoviride]